MDYLNGLGYKWVHYGSELFGNHVRRVDIAGTQIGIGRDNWPPQGNPNIATKFAPSVWLIDSVTAHGQQHIYSSWFFATIDHERRRIFYVWIKGDIRSHTWTFQGYDKNTAIVFHDCSPGASNGYYDGDKHIIPVEPLLREADGVHNS